ncbi:MAG: DUF1592 domain-containing protein, partial [Planctomycetaceae bacterium]|nr:DUF1592 domain-containing protein [Planctomycetaceae bacterium]
MTGCYLVLALLAQTPVSPAERDHEFESSFVSDVQPLLTKYCAECHSGERTEAEIDLAAFGTVDQIRSQSRVWMKIRRVLDDGQMPPPEATQPSDAERTMLRGWVREFLLTEAAAHAGDPGPVILRRLTNDEYNYTVRDLTGVDTLDPTREFPVDGAAGEGFTNTGSGQGMSPALVQKYLDAGKEVATHVQLLPDGIRFSPYTTRRDQTDDLLAKIQAFYRQYTADGGGTTVNLDGHPFSTNQGGLLPVDAYLRATLEDRDALRAGKMFPDDVARSRRLSPKYLTLLWETLNSGGQSASPLLDDLQRRWNAADSAATDELAAVIKSWQDRLWKFNSIGHIGREGGAKSWMEAVAPVTTQQELRRVIAGETGRETSSLALVSHAFGGEASTASLRWEDPRFEFPADRPGGTFDAIRLRDLRRTASSVDEVISVELGRSEAYLQALVDSRSGAETLDEIADRRQLNRQLLGHWATLLGFHREHSREITGYLDEPLTKVQGYDALNGWGSHQTPSLLTNRSEEPITFLTLTVPARGVTVHPSPELEAVVNWLSPVNGVFRIEGFTADADDKCGNGAAWRVELLTTDGPRRLAAGEYDNGGRAEFAIGTNAVGPIPVQVGDVVSLVVNARDHSHACDTTHVSLTLTEAAAAPRVWDLATDVVDRIQDGNPLPDSRGNADVWHFCAAGEMPDTPPDLVTGTALAAWRDAVQSSQPETEIAKHAARVRALTASAAGLSEADQQLRRTLRNWTGPLRWLALEADEGTADPSAFGLEAARFGGAQAAEADLVVPIGEPMSIRIPAGLDGAEFVSRASILAPGDTAAAAQVAVELGQAPSTTVDATAPIVIADNPAAQQRVETALGVFRELFPPALCYARIVPVDEVVTLLLFYREDDQLQRLMLNEAETAELDRLWDEFYFVSQEPLKLVVAFEQISEFATQDRPDLVTAFAVMREPILARAAAYRARRTSDEPAQLAAALSLADRAYRRPLAEAEASQLREFYHELRGKELGHVEALRLTLVRIFVSPKFLYRTESPPEGGAAGPVSAHALATRLSYFLWSSLPDAPLRAAADEGRMTTDDELLRHAARLQRDPKIRRLAEEFACQWLHVYQFDRLDEKSARHFPEFAELRGPMYEETIRFFADLFQRDGSLLDVLDADYAFVNDELAAYYGLPHVAGPEWRRIEGVRQFGRGGILAQAAVLARQAGASRTSPILRGNFVCEALLGEPPPKPPKNVPPLAETPQEGLTERQLTELHVGDPACAKCHARIDPFGFALEGYDAIGRARQVDAHGLPVDTRATLPDGTAV